MRRIWGRGEGGGGAHRGINAPGVNPLGAAFLSFSCDLAAPRPRLLLDLEVGRMPPVSAQHVCLRRTPVCLLPSLPRTPGPERIVCSLLFVPLFLHRTTAPPPNIHHRQVPMNFEAFTFVLTAGCWPLQSVSSSFKPPAPIEDYVVSFLDFYGEV